MHRFATALSVCPLLAVLSLALETPPRPAAQVETVREKRSGVDLPVELAPVGAPDAPAHELVGYGLRTKTIFGVHVYTVALYVDPATTKPALAPWRGQDQDEIEADSALYELLLKPASGKTLRLVMRRDVDAEDLRDAFEEALAPRVARAAEEFGMPGGAEALRTFRGFFDLDELEKGQVLDFTWTPAAETADGPRPGRLTTRVGTALRAPVENPALAWALFDVYLGGDPIEPDEKPKLVRRVRKLLQ